MRTKTYIFLNDIYIYTHLNSHTRTDTKSYIANFIVYYILINQHLILHSTFYEMTWKHVVIKNCNHSTIN